MSLRSQSPSPSSASHVTGRGGGPWATLDLPHQPPSVAAAVHEAVAGIQQALLWGLDVHDCRSLALDAFLELTASAWGAIVRLDAAADTDACDLVVDRERHAGVDAATDPGRDANDDDLLTLAAPYVRRAARHKTIVVGSVPAAHDRLLVLPVPGSPGSQPFVLLARPGLDYSSEDALGLEPLLRLTGQVDTWVREIQARRATERELERERHRLALALSASEVGVFEFDAVSGTLEWDRRVWAMHGLSPRDGRWTPQDWARLLHPDDAAGALAELMTAVAERRHLQAEYRVVHATGEIRHIRSMAQVFEHQAGRRVLVGVNIDVTADVRVQQELAAGRAQAEAATLAKSQFLAVMSHEIRTPMNGVLGMLELLLRSGLTAEQHEQAATAHASAESLLHLLNDILDLSKLESRQLTIETIPFEPARLVADTLALLAPRAAEKQLRLASAVDARLPVWISGDPMRLRQVLLNLVGNAIKFTATGEVTVDARADFSDSARPRLRIEVVDTGEGIGPETQERLFQHFMQADSSTARRFGGTGLGLAISRQLVELMGGRIGLTSTPGAGSTFWFDVPAVAAACPDCCTDPRCASRPAKAGLPPLRILAADDNAINRRLVQAFLAAGQHQVLTVESGAGALEALTSAVFDVVLLDIQMPVMDGPTCLERIRTLDEPLRRIPVIALTANAMAGDRDRYLAMGFDDYVSKPFTIRSLSEAIGRTLAAGVGVS